MKNNTSEYNEADVSRLINEIDKECMLRHINPGEFQREMIEAMVPIVLKWRSKDGIRPQYAGQLLSIARQVSKLCYSDNDKAQPTAKVFGAACHYEDGSLYITDQSGNGNHLAMKGESI